MMMMDTTTALPTQRRRVRHTILKLFQSLGIGLLPLWLPFLLSWGHTWNYLSVLDCRKGMIGDDGYNVTLICGDTHHVTFSHGRTPPTLFEWSNAFPKVQTESSLSWLESSSSLSKSTNKQPSQIIEILPSIITPMDPTTKSLAIFGWIPGQQHQHGFRKNPNRTQSVSSSKGGQRQKKMIPMTTILFLVLNLGIFVGLWKYKIDPLTVAFYSQWSDYCDNRESPNNNNNNDRIGSVSTIATTTSTNTIPDLGTIWLGHLSHFDVWHIGLNMMTWVSMGPTLEATTTKSWTTPRSIPLLLWTLSFLPLTSSVVWMIQHFMTRLSQYVGTGSTSHPNHNHNNNHNNNLNRHIQTWITSSSSSSTMVGFSGILCAWMMVLTLGDGPDSTTSTCPIVFLPNLCFETFPILPKFLFGNNSHYHRNWNIYFNLGPILQLVMLQVVLPRVSGKGHVSGLIVGWVFWHIRYYLRSSSTSTRILIEECVFQPSILYPMVWMICHYYARIFRQTTRTTTNTTSSRPPTSRRCQTNTTTTNASSWTQHPGRSVRGTNVGRSNRTRPSTTMGALLGIQILVCCIVWGIQGTISSVIFLVSSVINLILLQQVILSRASRGSRGTAANNDQEGNDDSHYGILSRAYIGLSLVLILTDGLTIGNWIVTRSLWTNIGMTILLIVSRDVLLFVTIGFLNMESIADAAINNQRVGTWWVIIHPIAFHITSLLEQSLQLVGAIWNTLMTCRIMNLILSPFIRLFRQWFFVRDDQDDDDGILLNHSTLQSPTSIGDMMEEQIALV